ncbi:MAG: hypothetical protein OHK0029_08470 [Armatimonadaceae bacterium]
MPETAEKLHTEHSNRSDTSDSWERTESAGENQTDDEDADALSVQDEQQEDLEQSQHEQSLLVKGIEQIVLGMTWIGFALSAWLTRLLVHAREKKRNPKKVYARIMDGYILLNFLAVCVAVFVMQNTPDLFRYIALPYLIWRILEIVCLGLRFSLFESAREARVFWASSAHIVVIGLIHYVEMALCFGGIYAGWANLIEDEQHDFWTPFHLSFATQMTIGYGDAVPTSWLRGVAHLQAFCGFILISVLIGRYLDSVGRGSQCKKQKVQESSDE